jgi:membrane associated rhomboid family serine protease
MFIPLHDTNPLQNIRLHYVTLGIIATNTLIWVFLGTPMISSPELARAASISFGFIPSVANDLRVLPPEYFILPEWTSYVTYSFLHGDFMHLAGNMLFVWVFADNVEDAMGHWRFAVFYVLCAAGGAWMHSFILPTSDSPLIGASGAASGVIGAYLMLHPHVKVWVLALGRIPLRLKAYWLLGAWILYQIGMLIFTTGSQVSWSAHVGGAITGIILIVFMRSSGVPLFDKSPTGDIKASQVEKEERKTKQPATRWGRKN